MSLGQITESPDISIKFQTLATTAIQRSEQGILCLIVKDSTAESKEGSRWYTISDVSDIDTAKWDATTVNFLKLASYTLAPYKILVCNQGDETIENILKEVKTRRISYLAAPQASEEEDTSIVAWVKTVFGTDEIQKTIRYVSGYADKSDHVAIIELANPSFTSKFGSFTAQQYTAAIAGMLCGMPLNRSADNLIMADLTNVEAVEAQKGKFSLYKDDEDVRVNLAVNSKTTFSSSWKESTRYIKIVEGMCMITDDIKNTFRDYWIGNYMNTYDNKMNFCSNVNRVYFKNLTPNVLSPDYDNKVEIDLDKQKQEIILDGRKDPSTMTELEIAQFPTGENVYLVGDIMLTNTMINLSLTITM